ncbi:hypothetical protein ElyMa_001041100 [Elysia marginata]|uniref:CCHC-type domain-containing protein n=1 Tax=Elysia marginata TaxID=1093978 RepID=A0AAV4HN59_9GAST|nr:hypothetical protein ElyMa_001041100 [Elysia marginata]
MAPFTASLDHKEMKNAKKIIKCSKCLGEGHLACQCHKHIVCWACNETGHKGSECPFGVDKSKEISSDEDNETSASDDSETEGELKNKKKAGEKNASKSSRINKHSTKNEGGAKKKKQKINPTKEAERKHDRTKPYQKCWLESARGTANEMRDHQSPLTREGVNVLGWTVSSSTMSYCVSSTI